jgi:hypothetical protein
LVVALAEGVDEDVACWVELAPRGRTGLDDWLLDAVVALTGVAEMNSGGEL